MQKIQAWFFKKDDIHLQMVFYVVLFALIVSSLTGKDIVLKPQHPIVGVLLLCCLCVLAFLTGYKAFRKKKA